MPNKNWNDTHKGDTMKEADGKKGKGKELTASETGNKNPQFASGMDSEGSHIVNMGTSAPGRVKS